MEKEKAIKFIKDNVKELSQKDGNVVLQMNQEPYYKFMAENGVDKKTLTAVGEARDTLFNSAIEFIGEEFVNSYDDCERVTLRVRTPVSRDDITINKSRTFNNPRTGEKSTKYGVVSVRSRLKIDFDKDVLDKCEKAIKDIA
jgi:hypothetical protein